MTALRKRIESLAGVWEGTYTLVSPSGEILDEYRSRQELRLVGDTWCERIMYLREGVEPEVYDFKAEFVDDKLAFDNPDVVGDAYLVGEDLIVLPHMWKSRPLEHNIETVWLPSADRKVRMWHVFESGSLAKIMIIAEEFRPDEKPVEW